MVDGPNAGYMNSSVLDRWDERLEDIFEGRPYDMLDAALTDTLYKFPLDIKVGKTRLINLVFHEFQVLIKRFINSPLRT